MCSTISCFLLENKLLIQSGQIHFDLLSLYFRYKYFRYTFLLTIIKLIITILLCSQIWQKYNSVQFSQSVVSDFVTPWTAACQASLSITNSWSLLQLMSIELVMPSNHLILCRPLLLLPSIFPNIRVFSDELVLHLRWRKYWSFRFSINPSNEYSGLVSFRIDWFDLLAVPGTLKNLLQHHSSKASNRVTFLYYT